MTVLTKPISEMKKKSPQSLALIQEGEAQPPNVLVVVAPVKKNGKGQRDRDVERLVTEDRTLTRMKSETTACLFLVGLLLMSIGILGGIYLYQQCARRPIQRLRGFLNIPYNNSDGRHLYYHLDSNAARQVASAELDINSGDVKKSGYFYEQFEADGAYERIDVPEYNGGRRGQFIHDWNMNKTGIVDVDGRRCFVIPLDRDAVVFLPSFVLDLARKLSLSSRATDVKVIVKTMKVVYPPLSDTRDVGEKIAQACSGNRVYSLVKATIAPGAPVKRSAEVPVVFGSFSGNTMKVEIVNYQEMVEAENEGAGKKVA